MATFSDSLEDDGGQEAVNEVLSGAESDVRIRALLEELPRIKVEASSWLETLVENEARFHADALVKMAHEANPASRTLLLATLVGLSASGGASATKGMFSALADRIRAR